MAFCGDNQYDDAHNNTYSTRWINPELKEHRSNISVFSCVYEEYSDSEHFFEFTVKTASILFQTKAASFVLAVSLILPVIMIGVGLSNLEECPLNQNIPVFVLVGGAIGLLKLLQILLKQYNRRHRPAEEEPTDARNESTFIDILTTLFFIVWFTYGNHIIYRYSLPSFEQTTEDPENWCTKNIYLLTIISVAYTYALVLLFILTLLIIVCTVHFRNRRQAERDANQIECR